MGKSVPNFKINITLCEQNPNKEDCVPACIKSVLDTCYPKNKIAKEEITKMVNTSKNKYGTELSKFKNLNRYLLKKRVPFKFETPDKVEVRGLSWTDIITPVYQKLPTICTVNRDLLEGKRKGVYKPHAIILAGKDGDSIKYFDPLILTKNDIKMKSITHYRFMEAWASTYKGAIFIKKTNQTKLIDE